MTLIVVGSVALDSIHTPFGETADALAALASLLPDEAERVGTDGTVESVAIDDLRPGDVVLVRRAGVGLFSLGTVSGATGTAFNISSLMVGIPLHAFLAGDEVLLVEAYWAGMVWRDFEPRNEQGWWAKEVVYTFRGSGALTYARTAAAVGS